MAIPAMKPGDRVRLTTLGLAACPELAGSWPVEDIGPEGQVAVVAGGVRVLLRGEYVEETDEPNIHGATTAGT